MVGIVVVSHSRALAVAAVALAAEMVHGEPVRIEVAAGLDDGTFGTDAAAIAAAVAEADDGSGDGVVVLMDLGSAVLSAELALELVDRPDLARRTLLSPGPFVEGLVAAAATAAGGAGRDDVGAEAVRSLVGKAAHLAAPAVGPGVAAGGEPAVSPEPTPASGVGRDAGPDVVRGEFVLDDPHGLHARPAARLTLRIRGLDARAELRDLTTGAGPVRADSLTGLATLGAARGHRLEVTASGPQARQAVDRVLELAAVGFDDAGETASAGAVVGPAWLLPTGSVAVPAEPAGDPATEWARLRSAVAAVRAELERLRIRTAAEAGEATAGIFHAHLLLLEDTVLLDGARRRLTTAGAATAWAAAVEEAEAAFTRLADPYLQARAADVRALGDQVLRTLLGADALPGPDGAPAGAVVVAPDLTPAQAAVLDPRRVAAVVLAHGSPVAHGVIVARARGVPVVVGAGAAVLHLRPGTPVAVDGDRGEVLAGAPPTSEASAGHRAGGHRVGGG